MALEKLLSGIKKEANIEAECILEKARKEAKEIIQKACQQVEKDITNLQNVMIARCRSEMDQQISLARLESQKRSLNARQVILNEVFNQALQELVNLSTNLYRQWMHDQIINISESGDETLVVSEKDRSRLNGNWLAKVNAYLQKDRKKGDLRMQFKDTDFTGGFILIHPQYEVVVSFSELLKTLRVRIQSKVANVLFGAKESSV